MRSTYIIAEAGVNHNGDLALALRMIEAAAQAGADAVKFQTFDATRLVSRYAPKANYQLATTDVEETQLEMLKKLQLNEAEHQQLVEHCKACGIAFLSSPFDEQSLAYLLELDMPLIKVPSGEITNRAFLQKIGCSGKPVVLSTGMATLGEVEAALSVLLEAGMSREHVTILHCNTEYPTPVSDVNLRAMNTLATAFDVAVGYSDHTEGIEVSIAAVARGARIIEKHFTLDRTLPGPDHQASLLPEELASMVRAIRNIEFALGSPVKQPSESERKNAPIARKSLVAVAPIAKGEIYTRDNLCAKRPGTGISPMRLEEMLGRPAPRSFAADELIEL